MSGHNKWSKIKNKKGSEDARRGKIFTKLGRNISVAVKEGGDNPEYNPALKTAIEKAKAENMPNDNIERAIKKASGDSSNDNYERVIYEGYGKGGVAVIVDCLTDNKNRTAPEVRFAFDKAGGNLGTDGSVMFMFNRVGYVTIKKADDIDFDQLMMDALEAGCDDIKDSGKDYYELISSVQNFNTVVNNLKENNYTVESSDIIYLAENEIEVEKDNYKSLIKLIETLEDNDDVQDVYTNWAMPEDLEIE